MKKVLLYTLVLLLAATGAMAQISTPSASPTAELSLTVGLTDVSIMYSRPGVKDREIFAEDGLVPFGKMWRTGANSATKITFGDDVKLGGQELAAGSYAILTMPMAKEWAFMLYPYESGSWGSYREKDPAAKFMAPVMNTGRMIETFTIDVNNLRNTSASIDFMWENTLVSVPLEVMVHDRVMADIKRTMAGPSASDYYAAATYLHDSGTDNEMALKYVQMANEGDNARYWTLRREALILAELGRTQEAINAATRSMKMAEEAGNEDYVRMNKASIAEWSN